MSFRAYRILIPVLVFVLVALAVLLLLMDSSFQAAQVAGYPGEGEGATATSGPYPGPNTRGPINPPAAPAYNSPTPLNATAHYLPVGGRAMPFQFSAGGANPAEVAVLVPDEAAGISGFEWGNAPDLVGRKVHMPRRCKAGRRAKYMCWIVNDWSLNADEGTLTRSNLAGISTPFGHNPEASPAFDADFPASAATDGFTNTRYIAEYITTTVFTIVDLHPVRLDEIVIDWHRESESIGGETITGTYAKSYTIEAYFNGQWHEIYDTTNGADAEEHIITSFTSYNDELVTSFKLTMTERGETTNDSYKYAINELAIYGPVDDQFFLRKPNPGITPTISITAWWDIWLSHHPGHIWLIGNEPDNFDHDVADGMRPEDYAQFYARAAIFLRERDPAAQIIFCQGTRAKSLATPIPPTPTPGSPTPGTPAPYGPHDFGPGYCSAALDYLRDDILPGSGYSATHLIDGFATHQYISTKIDNATIRATEVAAWQEKLNFFADWVNSLDDDDLDGRPLYLTEYGDLDNACAPTPTPVPPTTTTEPGTPTSTPIPTPPPLSLPDGCGPITENYAWFGDTNEQGFWAIQFHTTDYFLEACSVPNEEGCNAQWLGSWWFYVGGRPENAYIGGMFNSPNDLENENPNAYHYRDAINCHLNGISCIPSPTPTPTATATQTPTPTATQSSGGIGG